MSAPQYRPQISAVIIISDAPDRLAEFYLHVLDVPFARSAAGDDDVHYECDLGDVHLAIHSRSHLPWAGPPGSAVSIALTVADLASTLVRLEKASVPLLYSPKEFGFAKMVGLRDPDGNVLQLTELSPSWLAFLEERRKLR